MRTGSFKVHKNCQIESIDKFVNSISKQGYASIHRGQVFPFLILPAKLFENFVFLLISYFHMLLTDHLLPMTIGYIFQRVYRHFFPSKTFSQDICICIFFCSSLTAHTGPLPPSFLAVIFLISNIYM